MAPIAQFDLAQSAPTNITAPSTASVITTVRDPDGIQVSVSRLFTLCVGGKNGSFFDNWPNPAADARVSVLPCSDEVSVTDGR
jgi:hypothetical protein